MIPGGLIGTYIIYRDRAPNYIGRSDTNLRRRLLEHCATARGDYFAYEVHTTREQAYTMECSLYHGLRPLTNILHPDRPDHEYPQCPFCPDNIVAVLEKRLRTPNL
ncbi:GIY-YIG nuclease family protein [Streptomyces sp. NPDC014746]|uniref:GIY-YIG nuclease family protein n=1 Tax=Streptomyces sp. NPDC014746 TaxID=3364904 RepID=UPI0036F6D6E7